jgi:hypothetical protein
MALSAERTRDADEPGAGQSGGSTGAEGTSQGPRTCRGRRVQTGMRGMVRQQRAGAGAVRVDQEATRGGLIRNQRTGGPTDKRGAGPKKSKPRRTWKSG